MPPLRHRIPDLPAIVEQVLRDISPGRRVAPDTLRTLSKYDWPGNRVHAAAQLNISRATLYRKLHQYGITL